MFLSTYNEWRHKKFEIKAKSLYAAVAILKARHMNGEIKIPDQNGYVSVRDDKGEELDAFDFE